MNKTPIYIFIISLFFGVQSNYAQENPEIKKADSLAYKEKYGLRVGTDLSKLIHLILDDKYSGFEINADYRITSNLYPAIEFGFEEFKNDENNFSVTSKGSFIKAGANYNVYKNWIGMQNEIYVGLRYAFSNFSETLHNYTVYDNDHYFEPDHRESEQKFSSLNTHWLEFQVGVKAEVLNNLYLGLHVELKKIISSKEPDNFENLWIPDYNRQFDHAAFGLGWGYSISYMIPIQKKERKQKKE